LDIGDGRPVYILGGLVINENGFPCLVHSNWIYLLFRAAMINRRSPKIGILFFRKKECLFIYIEPPPPVKLYINNPFSCGTQNGEASGGERISFFVFYV